MTFISENKITYVSYRCMLNRTINQINYLNRVVCDRWRDPTDGFYNFIEDVGPRPSRNYTLDRINNDLGYFKENCRWADKSTQNHNRGKTKTSKDSSYIGVSMSFGRWVVQFSRTNSARIRERFLTELEAAIYYDNLSEKYYGDRPNKTTYRFIKPVIRRKVSSNLTPNGTTRVRVYNWENKRVTIGHFQNKDEAEEVSELLRDMICGNDYQMD